MVRLQSHLKFKGTSFDFRQQVYTSSSCILSPIYCPRTHAYDHEHLAAYIEKDKLATSHYSYEKGMSEKSKIVIAPFPAPIHTVCP
jgi:hypothetical protein